jgi:predicted nucleic acid-binding protein|tara:strand:+ start:815 stop:1105 length:291 start_codon:yes stop_codon:yes gene_type:complete
LKDFVLGCSVAMSCCFEDEANKFRDAVLDWFSKAQSLQFVELLHALPIVIDESTPNRATGEILSLARQHNFSSYDASYLELAMRKGVSLATQDNIL